MIGQTVSHYKIVRQLGAGGMGVVYAAEDPRLGRKVALKFVPEELAHDAHALERLRSEARTASGLSHPNICTIYDIGEHDGRPFIVMELLQGQTLRERMSARAVKIHETVEIGIQVADALYWAHTRDVIHRDIKPANLFLVEQGQLKILDFGLAKLVQAKLANESTLAPTVDLTAVGVTLGTVAYMSPEQVTGETLDRRTDLFSLGVVLYECATGQQPFKGKTAAVVFASILTQAPAPPVSVNTEVPLRLQEIIQNCLEKDRELRYQDAAALRTDLRRLKRDLESGASGALRTAAAAVLGASSGSVGDAHASASAEAASRSGNSASGPGRSDAAPRRRVALAGAGALAAVGLVSAFLYMRFDSAPPAVVAPAVPAPEPADPRASRDTGASPATRAAESWRNRDVRAALVYAEEALRTDPALPEALQIRNDARVAIARFDQAIMEAGQRIAAGDGDSATRALNTAKEIDPNAPAIADLTTRLVEALNAQAAAGRAAASPPAVTTVPPRRSTPAADTPAPRTTAAAPTPPPSAAPAAAPPAQAAVPSQTSVPPAQTSASANPAASTPAPPPSATAGVPSAPVRAPESPAAAATSADATPERRPAPATNMPPAAEDDDAAIRRVVASYARAIENKDLALFRSVKPNITTDEQRRIEEGFRAVTSQRVAITIVSIDRRGQEATVRLRRQDIIQAGGRTQTANSQQVMTLIRSASGWVIREIGR